MCLCPLVARLRHVCLPPQDALLRLAAVVDGRSLRAALRDSVQELIPSTVTHTHTHRRNRDMRAYNCNLNDAHL